MERGPDVASEEDLDGGGEGDGEEGTDNASEHVAPEEDGEHDGEVVHADAVADDAGLDDPAIELADAEEDGRHGDDMAHIVPGEPGDEQGRDAGGNHADVGDNAQEGGSGGDGEGIGQAQDFEGDAEDDTIDKADEHLATDEGDDVVIDLLEGTDDFIAEAGGAQGEDIVPAVGDALAFQQEVEEEDGHHDGADEVGGKA